MSTNTGVEKSDCNGEEQHPVSFLVAAGFYHSVAEAAPQDVHHVMGVVGGYVHDGQHIGQHPFLRHLFQPTKTRQQNLLS